MRLPEDGTFWAANEFATALLPEELPVRNNWGTWIAHFTISGSPSLTTESTGFKSLSFTQVSIVTESSHRTYSDSMILGSQRDDAEQDMPIGDDDWGVFVMLVPYPASTNESLVPDVSEIDELLIEEGLAELLVVLPWTISCAAAVPA